MWNIGDRVCALVTGGGYAEYCCAPEGQCLAVPPNLSFVDAASLPETYFTVWSNVIDRGQLRPGETFLVHGGAGGIGVAAIARNLKNHMWPWLLSGSVKAIVNQTYPLEQAAAAHRQIESRSHLGKIVLEV